MRTLQFTGVCILMLSFYSFAGIKDTTKNTYNSFTFGPALPLSNTAAMTIPKTNMKNLKPGWEAGWTFFGKPLHEMENALSGIALGGKVSYSSWRRDSTYTPVTFLGVEGLLRYYTPPIIRPFDVFAQVGAGWYIGEYSFTEADTVDWGKPKDIPVVRDGQNCLGFDFGAGVDIDIVEILPLVRVVMTKKELCIWFSLNLGMTF
jgi:hypothetical protein